MNVTAHLALRDRRHWLGRWRGLSVDRNGDLCLARVPSPANGKALEVPASYPCMREASGIAAGPCGSVFVADTAHDRILFVEGLCGAQAWLPSIGDAGGDAPGHFAAPRGLAVDHEGLVVADEGHGALQRLAFPRLEPHLAWKTLAAPVSVAFDARGRLLVVDAHERRVHRMLRNGELDISFAANLQRQAKLVSPFCVAVGDADCVLVSDTVANEVFVFDDDGQYLHSLPGSDGWMPGAARCAAIRRLCRRCGERRHRRLRRSCIARTRSRLARTRNGDGDGRRRHAVRQARARLDVLPARHRFRVRTYWRAVGRSVRRRGGP